MLSNLNPTMATTEVATTVGTFDGKIFDNKIKFDTIT